MRPFHGATKQAELMEMLLGDIFLNKSLLKYVALPQGFKMYILQRNNELCMHNISTKKYSEMLHFCRRGGIFKSSGKFFKSFRPVGLHFY